MSADDRVVTLEITDLAFDGRSVAHRDGKVVFLNGGLPGETVEAKIIRTKPRYDLATVQCILTKSDQRIDAVCEHFDYCGGCTWQDLDYDQQLRYKRKQVADCLERLGGFKDVPVRETVGSDARFFYRNKMEFSFDAASDRGFTLGLHRRGRWDSTFDLRECHLQSQLSNSIVAWMRNYVAGSGLPAYDVRLNEGFWRFLVIREAKRTAQTMVNVVTNQGDLPDPEGMVEGLRQEFPQITTIIHSQNGQKANVAVAETETVLWGPGYIEEQLADKRFRIRASSFFQTNTVQAETLYRDAFDMLESQPTDRVLDLYCGAGSIGILLAGSVAEVVGVELVEDAITAARENAHINGVENISFFQGNVKDFLRDNPAAREPFDSVIVDPPRAGLNPKVVRQLLRMKPPRIQYISCNPATFARDAKEFAKGGYSLSEVQPVDMFPHTMHIEATGRLVLV